MGGFLGTDAALLSDLSLVLTIVLGIAAIVGAIRGRRRRISRHCPVMRAAALLNWLPVLVVMVPKWLGVIGGSAEVQPGLQTILPLAHGIIGGVTQLVMTYTVVRMTWMEDWPPREPIWLMRGAIGLWIITTLGGLGVYLTLYVR